MTEDHNGPQWLVVRYIEQRYRNTREAFWPGWYVVRTCPCHWNELVTLGYETRQDAEQVRNSVLAVSKANAALG
jgi:hypothetical protein